MRNLSFLDAFCKDCGHRFAMASLGDFSYGDFVLETEDARTYAYVSVFDAEAAEIVERIPPDPPPNALLRVLAALADPIDGKALRAERGCPKCGSLSVDWYPDNILRVGPVHEATYTHFFSQSADEQQERLAGALAGCSFARGSRSLLPTRRDCDLSTSVKNDISPHIAQVPKLHNLFAAHRAQQYDYSSATARGRNFRAQKWHRLGRSDERARSS